MIEDYEEEIYEVESLKDIKKLPSGQIKVLVKWVGYPINESTWEPCYDNLNQGSAILFLRELRSCLKTDLEALEKKSAPRLRKKTNTLNKSIKKKIRIIQEAISYWKKVLIENEVDYEESGEDIESILDTGSQSKESRETSSKKKNNERKSRLKSLGTSLKENENDSKILKSVEKPEELKKKKPITENSIEKTGSKVMDVEEKQTSAPLKPDYIVPEIFVADEFKIKKKKPGDLKKKIMPLKIPKTSKRNKKKNNLTI